MTEQGREAVPDSGGEHPTFDPSVAHLARVYDYWLGGKDNYAADGAAGDAVMQVYPGMATSVRANRAFLARVVRYLAGQAGIRQFLDIGTGIPASSNTHEVAQQVSPDCSVVYVDNDPVVLAHARALLTTTPQGRTDYIDADLRDTGTILQQAAQTLDFSQPIAVMLIAVLHVLGNDEDPYGVVAKLMNAVPSGSYLAISHVPSDMEPEKAAEAGNRLNQLMYEKVTFRSHPEVTHFFDGLELVEPGVVRIQEWRPGTNAGQELRWTMWGGLARKP